MKNFRILLGLGLMATACATADPTVGVDPEQAQEPIIGGTDDTGDPAVVALFAHKPGETSGSLCTATLISPTVLLTAAHCVSPAVVGDGNVFEARLGPNARSPQTVIPVKEVHWDQAFDVNNLPGGHDIAVAILQTASTERPIPYIKRTIPGELMGTDVRLVGYGLNDGFDQSGASAGTKRQVATPLQTIQDMVLEVGQFGKTSCNGDSGGPAFARIDGVETVVGVTSYGFVYCLFSGYYTRVDLYTDFIDQYAGGPSCTPACSGKECGSDGCGGDCGRCNAGETCTADQCVPEGEQGCPLEDEGNDDASQANALCDDRSVLGSISGPTDNDWFAFDVKPGTTYTVLLDNVSDGYKLTLYKKSAKTGNLMVVGDAGAAGSNQLISRRTSDGGKYYVKVSGSNVSASNQYGLFVRP